MANTCSYFIDKKFTKNYQCFAPLISSEAEDYTPKDYKKINKTFTI